MKSSLGDNPILLLDNGLDSFKIKDALRGSPYSIIQEHSVANFLRLDQIREVVDKYAAIIVDPGTLIQNKNDYNNYRENLEGTLFHFQEFRPVIIMSYSSEASLEYDLGFKRNVTHETFVSKQNNLTLVLALKKLLSPSEYFV